VASLEAVVSQPANRQSGCLTHLLQGVDGAAAAEEVQVAVGWMSSVGGREDDWGMGDGEGRGKGREW